MDIKHNTKMTEKLHMFSFLSRVPVTRDLACLWFLLWCGFEFNHGIFVVNRFSEVKSKIASKLSMQFNPYSYIWIVKGD